VFGGNRLDRRPPELAPSMFLRPLLSLAFVAAFAVGEAKADPMVVAGLYPGEQRSRAVEAEPAAEDAPDFGGGFLEMLFTGGEGGSRRADAEPGPLRRSASYVATPGAQLASARGPAELEAGVDIDPAYRRAEVDYSGAAAGTIVIDTADKYLYLVERGGRAIRYGIGVGRPGFEWSGVKAISRKAEWPAWTPPPQMLKRRPDLPPFMPGGPENPLGARALYLGSSLYRIHGTNEPDTIGQNVSSGCIRMMNEDVEDLYDRVHVGTRVLVR
jgi:lipoprotein-anchoring transpeptidase ErfK/SrfK